MIQYLCDGCRVKIVRDDLVASGREAQRVAAGNRLRDDVYCPKCLPRAEEYWKAKMVEAESAYAALSARMDNFRNRFWNQARQQPTELRKVK